MKRRLYEMLASYAETKVLPMHMPGHKRNPKFHMINPYEIDITEIGEFDNLHHPEGVLRKQMDEITKIYGSDQSYLLVNGSTCGILAALTACCNRGDRIAVARNCHKSVYNAIRLLELRPVYLYPENEEADVASLGIAGRIAVNEVVTVLEQYPDIACVVITSPTYEGLVSPVREIAEAVHGKGTPLIVDEAHGAHFQWHEAFPETALHEGADVVIESLHKTLPAFTQTAVLHARFERVEQRRLEWALQTYQSSSPSYLLMASIDQCYRFLRQEGDSAFSAYVEHLTKFREKMKALRYLRLWEGEHKELSKIVIVTEGAGVYGREFADILYREYRIELEMSCGYYCIAMTSVCDESESFERLARALLALDRKLGNQEKQGFRYAWQKLSLGMYSYEVPRYETEVVDVCAAAGCIAAEDIYLYPPGVPIVVAGEWISEEIVTALLAGQEAGYEVKGIRQGKIEVLNNRCMQEQA